MQNISSETHDRYGPAVKMMRNIAIVGVGGVVLVGGMVFLPFYAAIKMTGAMQGKLELDQRKAKEDLAARFNQLDSGKSVAIRGNNGVEALANCQAKGITADQCKIAIQSSDEIGTRYGVGYPDQELCMKNHGPSGCQQVLKLSSTFIGKSVFLTSPTFGYVPKEVGFEMSASNPSIAVPLYAHTSQPATGMRADSRVIDLP